jgi:hypothetical protein
MNNKMMYVIFAYHRSPDGFVTVQILWATNDESTIQSKYKEFLDEGYDCYIDECDGFIKV